VSDPLDALHDTNSRRRIHRLYSAINTPPERKLRGFLPLSTDGPAPPRVHHVHRGSSRVGTEHGLSTREHNRPILLPPNDVAESVPAAAHHREGRGRLRRLGWPPVLSAHADGAFARPPPTPGYGGGHHPNMATMIKRGKGSDDPMVGTMGGNESRMILTTSDELAACRPAMAEGGHAVQ